SYVEQGRTALLDGKHTDALIYLAEAAHHGDDSPIVKFMLDRAAQPLRAEVARLPAGAGRMWSAVVSPDGRWIVTTDDISARVWDARVIAAPGPRPEPRFTLSHDASVFHASFNADGT